MNDLISRKAAIKAIEELPNCYNGFSDTFDKACIIGVLEELPTVEPVKHGRWETVTNGRGGFECSICHSYAPSYQDGVEWLSLYCPNCGAKMDEEEAETENEP